MVFPLTLLCHLQYSKYLSKVLTLLANTVAIPLPFYTKILSHCNCVNNFSMILQLLHVRKFKLHNESKITPCIDNWSLSYKLCILHAAHAPFVAKQIDSLLQVLVFSAILSECCFMCDSKQTWTLNQITNRLYMVKVFCQTGCSPFHSRNHCKYWNSVLT